MWITLVNNIGKHSYTQILESLGNMNVYQFARFASIMI